MTTAIVCLSTRERALHQLAEEILNRHRSHLRELRIEVVEGGVIIHGRAIRFYGKQIAFHEVSCRCRLAVVANQIEVSHRPTEANVG